MVSPHWRNKYWSSKIFSKQQTNCGHFDAVNLPKLQDCQQLIQEGQGVAATSDKCLGIQGEVVKDGRFGMDPPCFEQINDVSIFELMFNM